MESAIPNHLKQSRTQTRGINDDYEPPYPATVARFAKDINNIVMAYFGVQFPSDQSLELLPFVLETMSEKYDSLNGPNHWDIATYEDEKSYINLMFVTYWPDPLAYQSWTQKHALNWLDNPFNNSSIGTFIEELTPSVQRFETLYSSGSSEGIDNLSRERSGSIQEHAYWGAMRDRIPLSQTDALKPSGSPLIVSDGLVQKVLPQQNLCLIRSGQDWTLTENDQREMYLSEVEPVLKKGMDFLRDEGESVNCYANRYMRILDRKGNQMDQTFGMSWWRSLEQLEAWSKSHPTHIAIFGVAMKYLNRYTSDAQLKLYHEVTVADKTEQRFEYYNCHEKTGLLKY